MLAKSIRIAWDIIHVLDTNYIKKKEVTFRLRDRFNIKVSNSYVGDLVTALGCCDLIDTKRGTGVRRAKKVVDFIDVCAAMGYEIDRGFSSPHEKVGLRLFDTLKNIHVSYTGNKH